ncbi:MAG: TetM/TetW/TetO/TetS family tetracycline resistance ribosomal protection protein [Clostridiales bacterium]|nr:TetM/TetW/TetO/TetS family tetracycline resistance ribosomal protection protein [Candidatus Blautia equi]
MKKLIIGILAHVDAGKTTLSESLLYLCGRIRKLGRVDHKDAFLDNYELEKARGITIFSKQAQLSTDDMEITLLDTPGHVDFSAEMERTLQVLDYAILVINGMDGVQSHTMTLWRLLERYQVPVFLFINKMDQDGTDRDALMAELKKRLSGNCVDFSADVPEEEWKENVAVCHEDLLEEYLESGELREDAAADLIESRELYPCYFGSALKLTGVEDFLRGLGRYTKEQYYPEEFGAKVFKIARDDQGNRLTYMKITGGSLKVKTILSDDKSGSRNPYTEENEDGSWEEKVDQMRVYSGARFEPITEAAAGSICAVTGLTRTYPGEGLGAEPDSEVPVLEPVLNYQIILPSDCDVHVMLRKLRQLEEEEPQLHIVWDEQLGEIHAQLMGEVQTEILKSLIWDRFKVAVDFGNGNIVYKETIAEPMEGVGHYEPLRHYAEVHLLLEPGERGSGIQLFTACSEDVLSRNWQRLIFTHLEEKEHLGVLTGSPITDIQITLVTGKAHLKHTEGGDFRQATYRAVRQGLKKARSILLEPYYEFRLEVPADVIGRAMTDIQKMKGTFGSPEQEGDMAILTGTAPVSGMRDYQSQVISYSRGEGRLFCSLKGYAPCDDQDEVVKAIGYDSERDMENPTSSVFCAHGAGFLVPWYQVDAYAHMEGGVVPEEEYWELPPVELPPAPKTPNGKHSYSGSYAEEEELKAIFERTFGAIKKERAAFQKRVVHAPSEYTRHRAPKKIQDEYLLVDGYNIIFSWDDLRELSKVSIDAARDQLMEQMSNYQGFKKCHLILVFDAYRVQGHREEIMKYHNIDVVFTKEAETADQFIEKTAHKLSGQNLVTVATSDGLEQIIIMGQGAVRMTASDLKEELDRASTQIRQEWTEGKQSTRNFLIDQVSPEMARFMEDVRLGKKEL